MSLDIGLFGSLINQTFTTYLFGNEILLATVLLLGVLLIMIFFQVDIAGIVAILSGFAFALSNSEQAFVPLLVQAILVVISMYFFGKGIASLVKD